MIHARQFLDDVLLGVWNLTFDPRDIEIDATVWASAAIPDLVHDASRDVIAREQFRRTARVTVAFGIAPSFFLVVRGLCAIVLRNVVEHESTTLAIDQNTTVAAD